MTKKPASSTGKKSAVRPLAGGALAPPKGKTRAAPSRDAEPISPPRHAPRGPLIVGIGASAGGLEAMKAFLRTAPSPTGVAFVLVQHLDPTHESLMASILANHTSMKVATAIDGMKLESERLYVGPPGSIVTIHDGAIRLAPVSAPRGPHFPIDALLRSLAEDQGERAIAVILSGAGTDGTIGVQAVKANGGTVLVQDPRTAAFDGMPGSAIGTGFADLVLPAEQMAPRIAEFAQHPYSRAAEVPALVAPTGLDGVLTLLRVRNGYDFRPYKELTLSRRIQRRMGLKGKTQMDDYAQVLRDDPRELKLLQNDLLISVTSFFRDPDAFAELEEALLSLSTPADDEAPFRAWVCGCATGEEAYSVAMSTLEFLDQAGRDTGLQLFASDVNADALKVARVGAYPRGALAEVSRGRRDRFFAKEDNEIYRAKKSIRDSLVFANHNVLVDPPFFNLDLITCRNLLIYLQPAAQKRVISLFHAALKPGGILFLGSAESVPPGSGFETISSKARIYKRTGPARRINLAERAHGAQVDPLPAAEAARALTTRSLREPRRLEETARAWLLDSYAPASVLVDAEGQIVYLHGPVGNYLDLPRGAARFDLMAMPRQGLGARLRVALANVKRKKGAVDIQGVRIKRNGGTYPINVRVKPAPSPPFTEALLLVTFEEASETTPKRATKGARQRSRGAREKDEKLAEQLEAELAATKADLQGTIEAMETANEELKASNEEMMSMNEEFRSTNEELETSKEELQSLNEELQTVNSQLKDKQETVEKVNDDLLNLLRSTEIATLFLDRENRISRFTPASRKLFAILPSDVGRPLSDLSRNFLDEDIVRDIANVLEDATPIEKMIRTTNGQWYLRRIQPYRTQDGRVAGTVVTFVDVDALKKAERAMHSAKEYAQNVVETVREPLVVLDMGLRVKSANAAFYKVFETEPTTTLGELVYDLGNGQWNIPNLRNLLQRMASVGDEVRDFEVTHTFGTLGERTMLLNAKQVRVANEGPAEGQEDAEALILLAIEDVTARKTAEIALQALAESLDRRVRERTVELEEANRVLKVSNESLDAFSYVVGHDLKEPTRAIESIFSVIAEDHAGDLPMDVQELLAKGRAANRRLSALVTGLLAFSRSSRADVTDARSIALDDALRLDDCTARFRDRFAERGARLEYPSHEIVVHAHLPALCQVLGNVVENAVKHNPKPAPLVRVGAKYAEDGNTAEVVVEDDGPGFPSDVVAGLDDMSATTRGFGLAIAKRTVELLGGKLWLGRSSEGGGAVHFTLPARPGRT